MSPLAFDPARTALLLLDLQNEFLHPDGAYAQAGVGSPAMAALPGRLAPLAASCRRAGIPIVSTHFTLVPGHRGAPLISAHLARLRPFLGPGHFAPGSFGHDLLAELKPADYAIEKVAFSAFYMSRLEFVLRRIGAEILIAAGIVTEGGVSSTVRDAHVRDFECVVLSDGCATFRPDTHNTALAALAGVAHLATVAEVERHLHRAPQAG